MNKDKDAMRSVTYSKFIPGLLDAINLQELLDELSDFLLQSGFAGGPFSHPYWGEFGDDGGERTLDGLRQAILEALIKSGKLTQDMMQVLRGESTGDPQRDRQVQQELAELLDQIVRKLIEGGYLNLEQAPRVPEGHQPVFGPGGQARSAAQQVQFNLTDKGLDFLGYRALRHLLGSVGKSSFGSHDTAYLATGVEAEAVAKEYEFGDTMNLDVPGTLGRAMARSSTAEATASGPPVPRSAGAPVLDLDYPDLMVFQSEYRSSAATALMLDCSHSMVLYGEDRFTPAKKVALALTHLIRTQFPGDSLRVVLFHDSAEEIPIERLAHAQVGPYHTNTAEGLKLARRLLLAQKKDMRQIIMITDGKPSALTLPDGRVYVNSMGLDPRILQETYREVALCRRAGIMINTFMLARERSLVEFVKRVCEIAKGKAYFTSTMTLGQYILMDFMRRKT
ncbi:MAG TPA: VWA domain-containing protein, partial [Gemmatimonadales bacterium]|nr:VWA domain-containing protein [Gemmatimonadales bacterium]